MMSSFGSLTTGNSPPKQNSILGRISFSQMKKVRCAQELGFPLRCKVIGWTAHYSTSEWKSGEIVRETYDALVLGGVKPGTHYMRAFLYQDRPRQDSIPLTGAPAKEGLFLGTIRVEDR